MNPRCMNVLAVLLLASLSTPLTSMTTDREQQFVDQLKLFSQYHTVMQNHAPDSSRESRQMMLKVFDTFTQTPEPLLKKYKQQVHEIAWHYPARFHLFLLINGIQAEIDSHAKSTGGNYVIHEFSHIFSKDLDFKTGRLRDYLVTCFNSDKLIAGRNQGSKVAPIYYFLKKYYQQNSETLSVPERDAFTTALRGVSTDQPDAKVLAALKVLEKRFTKILGKEVKFNVPYLYKYGRPKIYLHRE